VVALWRMRSSKAFQSAPRTTILRPIDAEIDMRRHGPAPSKISRGFSRLLRWMLPEGDIIAPPKRSIARELEEEFPTNDR
jgi:hypothetical protein